MDSLDASMMMAAYVRRKRFEAMMIAAEVGRLFAGDGKRTTDYGRRTTVRSGGEQRISGMQLLHAIGVEA